jgi:hypothetical protein
MSVVEGLDSAPSNPWTQPNLGKLRLEVPLYTTMNRCMEEEKWCQGSLPSHIVPDLCILVGNRSEWFPAASRSLSVEPSFSALTQKSREDTWQLVASCVRSFNQGLGPEVIFPYCSSTLGVRWQWMLFFNWVLYFFQLGFFPPNLWYCQVVMNIWEWVSPFIQTSPLGEKKQMIKVHASLSIFIFHSVS